MSSGSTTEAKANVGSSRRPGIVTGPSRRVDARVKVPSSKSLTNRALVAAAVAGGGVVERPLDCEDTRLLADALAVAGWQVERAKAVTLGPRSAPPGEAVLDLGNSGTGARLLLALLAAVPGRAVVDGSDRLRERPMGPLLKALRRLGAQLGAAPGDALPVRVDGRKLAGGRVKLAPQVSSQFVSALLLAAPLMTRGLELEVEGAVPSRPYLRLTQQVLLAFGAAVETDRDLMHWRVGPGPLEPIRFEVEGDWSAAAFFAAAAAVSGGAVTIENLSLESAQGDRRIVEILASAGVEIEGAGGGIAVRGRALHPFAADLGDSPDLFPALAVVAAAANPGSELSGLEHLRHKESDRLAVMVDNLGRLGARLEVAGDTVRVERSFPGRLERPVEVSAASDHRIAMAMAVAALIAGPLRLDDLDCVGKSFPGFWREWEKVVR